MSTAWDTIALLEAGRDCPGPGRCRDLVSARSRRASAHLRVPPTFRRSPSIHGPYRYIRDAGKTIQDLINETIARLRENIVVRRIARFELGGG